MEYYLEHYGYIALFLGTFIEGETILILAGFLSHRGYLNIHWVILIAFLGSLTGDQFYFYLGRIFGTKIIARSKRLQIASSKIYKKLAEYETIFILSFRFIYGIRTASPIVIGTSTTSAVKYSILNASSAAIWAVAFSSVGYFFGKAFEFYLGKIKRYEHAIAIAIIAIGIVLFVVRKIRERKEIRQMP
ncbi:MAG TPA: DedA family protein [Spirochaetota bacterium]|nr:DedA family protein [Spirochaetota bacterium]